MFKKMALILALIALSGCEEQHNITYKFDCVRVFMHTPLEYSFYVQEGLELKAHTFLCTSERPVRIYCDVKDGKPMWFQATSFHTSYWDLEIHLHAPQEVDGGQWRKHNGEGNTYRGATTPIE